MHFVRAEEEGAPFAERDEEHSHLLRDGCRPLSEKDGSLFRRGERSMVTPAVYSER
jgi:hypothetical protein